MDPLDKLRTAKERLNPAIAMNRKLAAEAPLDAKQLLLMTDKIESAIKSGSDEIRKVGSALAALKQSEGIPSTRVPEGF